MDTACLVRGYVQQVPDSTTGLQTDHSVLCFPLFSFVFLTEYFGGDESGRMRLEGHVPHIGRTEMRTEFWCGKLKTTN